MENACDTKSICIQQVEEARDTLWKEKQIFQTDK